MSGVRGAEEARAKAAVSHASGEIPKAENATGISVFSHTEATENEGGTACTRRIH